MDFNNILFRYFRIYENLKDKGKNTGGIYGFVTQFCYQINLHKPEYVIVCGDFPPYKRKLIFPEYKHKVYKKDDGTLDYYVESKKYCMEFLERLGLPLFVVEGYECDDLVADIINKNQDKEFVIVSNDDDLFQLLNEKVSLFRKKKLYKVNDFKREYNVPPLQWSIIKAMSGGHNNIKPIYKGLGTKTAIKIFNDPVKWEEFLEGHRDKFIKNLSLVKLPFDNNIPSYEFKKASFNERDVINWLMREFGIKITGAMEEALAKIA